MTFVSGAGLFMFSLSIAFWLIEVFLDRVAVVTFITPVGKNSKLNLRRLGRRESSEIRPGARRMPGGPKADLAGAVPFLRGRQNQAEVRSAPRTSKKNGASGKNSEC